MNRLKITDTGILRKGEPMENNDYGRISEAVRDAVRLKTYPIAVKFLENGESFPEKTRRPSQVLKKRVTICQAVTMARVYGWTVGLTREDLICVPAMIAFGFSGADDPAKTLASLFCQVDFAKDEQGAQTEVNCMSRLENNPKRAIVLGPLFKTRFTPDVVAIYGNPAQIMRMVQALVYKQGSRISGNFGGKVECSEYLLAPLLTEKPRLAIPGMGDRIFSMTQDDEMVLSFPAKNLADLHGSLQSAGKKIGARYPVTFYQNFEPQFPEPYQELAETLGLF